MAKKDKPLFVFDEPREMYSEHVNGSAIEIRGKFPDTPTHCKYFTERGNLTFYRQIGPIQHNDSAEKRYEFIPMHAKKVEVRPGSDGKESHILAFLDENGKELFIRQA
jgi:hypothetical protein